ncbi:MAG: hypothetical protein AAF401_15385 [Pseudomonadota bacterium]
MKLKMLLAALGAAACATSALALEEVDPLETLSIVDVDLSVQDAHSAPIQFDLNGDGFNDFEIAIGNLDFPVEDGINGEFATITALRTFVSNGLESDGGIIVSSEEFFVDPHTSFPSVATFQRGDDVSFDIMPGFSFQNQALLFAGDEGPFSAENDTAFIGLSLIIFDDDEVFQPFLGWAEITRGSVTVGEVGFQTQLETEAPIPVTGVPVPPAFALFAGALALFGFVARRRPTVA